MQGPSVGTMRTMPIAKVTGLWRDCVLVLGMLGQVATAAEIHEFMRGEGEAFSMRQVQQALAGLCRSRKPWLRERSGGVLVPPSRQRGTGSPSAVTRSSPKTEAGPGRKEGAEV